MCDVAALKGDPEDRPGPCHSGARGLKPKALGPGKPSPARAGSGVLPGVRLGDKKYEQGLQIQGRCPPGCCKQIREPGPVTQSFLI